MGKRKVEEAVGAQDGAAVAALVVSALEQAADPSLAPGMERYMRSQYPFYGISSKPRRVAVGRVFAPFLLTASVEAIAAYAHFLYDQPRRECHYAAMDGCCEFIAKKRDALTEPQHLVLLGLLKSLIQKHSWWDTVDQLASSAVGPLVRPNPHMRATINSWRDEGDLWLRRTSLIYQLAYKGDTDKDALFANCATCLADKEFFIQKAAGWALRQFSRTDRAAVAAFVAAHEADMTAVCKREAKKYI
jgi:3-methyladenine DNA glycosylase AlkD